MQTLFALIVAAAAAYAAARPPGPSAATGPLMRLMHMREQPPPELFSDYQLPRMLLPHYMGYDDSPVVLQVPENDWLNKEIDRINQMDQEVELISPYDPDLLRLYSQDGYLLNFLDIQEPNFIPNSVQASINNVKPMPRFLPVNPGPRLEAKRGSNDLNLDDTEDGSYEARKRFALTPMDEEYYKPVSKQYKPLSLHKEHQEGGGRAQTLMVLELPRQTRQNPNLSKQKHLLEPDLGKLKAGLTQTHNFGLLMSEKKLNVVDDVSSAQEEGEAGKMRHVQVLEPPSDSADSIYSIALVAAVGAALTMAIVGFAFGWYTLSRKAKAAADVDYPAYGVTGPTVDSSGDRKLAHSAHMYHYQHQKQQIIAMERNGLEQRAGSVSDPESEEENEEGDYTVYECPGFATTGDMEVKNPLFSEEPLLVTPGKCEVVKQQPKD